MSVQEILSQYAGIPAELKSARLWVNWAGKDKIPRNPHTGGNAKSNDPATWGTFDQAAIACVKYGFGGIGLMLQAPYFGVDLDHCIEEKDFCDEFIDTLQSYNEYSMSGTGLHIICKGSLPDGARRRGSVEMYQGGRYFAMTGKQYNNEYPDVVDCTDSIKILHQKYLPDVTPAVTPAAANTSSTIEEIPDDEIIEKAKACKSGERFEALFSGDWEDLEDGSNWSHSEADMALCNMLAFWTAKNKDQMDRIFRKSGLMRKKWERDDYRQLTIDRACSCCKSVYDPNKYDDDGTLAVEFFGRTSSRSARSGKEYDPNDTGNAHRLFDMYGDVIRYSHTRKKWYVWTGKQWMLDETGEIKKMADNVIEHMKKEAMNIDDEKLRAAAMKFVNRSSSHNAKESMIKECQHLSGIPVTMDELDPAGEYINCVNGVVNLKTGELLPHDPHMMMTKMCSTEYDTTKKKPEMWLKFLDDVTNGNDDLIEYIQRCIGYSLTGTGQEQCAYFLYGIGNNGKSTFLDTISDMLGSYSSNAQPDTLMLQGRGSGGGGANSDIARLKSARFVTCEEPTEGVRLNEGLLKQLTGGGNVTARFLYGDEFEFRPEFAAWIATNHKPVIRGTDVGIWRRIKLIPFEVNIASDKVDKKLKYKLRKEFPQIMSWAVEGCIKWQKDGLKEPDCVTVATQEYKQEMDLVACFVDQCLVIDYNSTERIMSSDVFAAYIKWAKANNEYEMSAKKFGMELAKKVPEKGRSSKGNYYSKVVFSDYGKTFMQQQYTADQFK